MSFKTAEDSVQAWFNGKWVSGAPPVALTPIAWPDVQFTPPNGTWIRFTMTNNLGNQASIGSPGSNYFRRRGIIVIQVFAKENTGGADCRTKAQKAVDIFMTNDLAGFEFTNVNARAIGNDGAGWYQWNVTAEYKYDITA